MFYCIGTGINELIIGKAEFMSDFKDLFAVLGYCILL